MRICLYRAVTETFDNNKLLRNLIVFKNFNITEIEQYINELVAIYKESSNFFQEEILEETFFYEQRTVNQEANITSDEYVDTTCQ